MNKNTLVIGASTHPERYSNKAIHKLSQYGHPVVAIGKNSGIVGEITIHTGFPSLENIHTVTLYINPTIQPSYYDYILSLHPKRVIFNPGTENADFYDLLAQNNIEAIEACTLVMLQTRQF
jgi:predicted CoA-binding protein